MPTRTFFYSFILTPLLFSAIACTPNIKPPVMIDQGKVQVISHHSTQVATYLKSSDPGLWLCKENITDAIKTSHEGATLTGLTPKENVHIGEASGALSLGGMAPEVLITSELLYRACELCANLNADEELTLKIYQMFLDAVDKTASTQTKSGANAIYGEAANAPSASTSPSDSVNDSETSTTDSDDDS